jgi:hypothetical protein
VVTCLEIMEEVLHSPIHGKLQSVEAYGSDSKCCISWLNCHILLFAKAPVYEMFDARIE